MSTPRPVAERILVIEDNKTNRELMVYLLNAFGYPTAEADNGRVGLEMARQTRPRLIVCDIQIPELDGYGVIRELRLDQGLGGIPVVAVTALAMVGDRERILAAGFDGYVAKRGVQVGQKVAAGAPLMAVVPLRGVWVDANFKESQLQSLRIGQPVALEADIYGNKVEYHGKVAGLGAGTGSAFSLLPAQNATGNWIKIVQRVPVRIELQSDELTAHPLRLGLSMNVTVDIRDASGKALADAPRSQPIASTDVFDDLQRNADDRVRQIVASNGTAHTRASSDARIVAAAPKASSIANAH